VFLQHDAKFGLPRANSERFALSAKASAAAGGKARRSSFGIPMRFPEFHAAPVGESTLHQTWAGSSDAGGRDEWLECGAHRDEP
jgi:hypothetical protein